jgi:hypothetical protein
VPVGAAEVVAFASVAVHVVVALLVMMKAMMHWATRARSEWLRAAAAAA